MKHLFKLDPAKQLPNLAVQRLARSGTDGFIIGGSDGLEIGAVQDLFRTFASLGLPVFIEVSDEAMIVPGASDYLIPMVLNSTDVTWLIGAHHEIVKQYGSFIPWPHVQTEGYCILNPEAKAAQLAKANTDLSADDVAAYASIAENMLRLPIFYVEYSGAFGDSRMVQAARNELVNTKLWYGGGIRTVAQAREMSEIADVIVVGNILYEDFEQALETVSAVR
ncbi:heptaprenylglyceryl phosphate synthase [Listeria grandensis]|uniref:Heptaprenylglyceryl phosphate synthase n=1 Tax=Listeria grandensis TaxID=1494963 RepID=A0A7X0Y480_9LIST|nr:heptaprenylglyceryl phosphate synthase [Listeria grandensis]MBC1475451.1 heptaprenylglyceryl phosphate synthase [Listeria grandensis]MBC1936666.1 heptaprenylglyceryl phosphate synthase [Listeria grandensis]